MAFSFVQEAHSLTYASGIPTLTATGNVTKGNLLVVWATSTASSGVYADDGYNAWIPISSGVTGGYGTVFGWYAISRRTGPLKIQFFNASAASSSTPVSLSSAACQFMEWAGNGQLPLETSASATGTGTSISKALTVTGTADLILGIPIPASGSTTAETAGWANVAGAGVSGSAIYQIETASGTFTPTFTQSPTGAWGILAVAFRTPAATHTISGSLGSAGASALIYFISSTTQTVYSASADGSGNYTSPALENDTYTVSPQIVGCYFSPATSSQALSGANITGVNFTAIKVATNLSFTTVATDTMQRANENPLSDGGNWLVDGTPVPPWDPPCQILSNECVMSDATVFGNFAGPWTGDGEDVWRGTALGNDQFMEMQVDSLNSDVFSYATAYCAIRAPNNYSNSYNLIVRNNGGGTCDLFLTVVAAAVTPSTWFNLGRQIYGAWTYYSRPFTSGDKFRLAVVGNILHVLHNGVVIGNYRDTQLTSGTAVIEVTGKSITDAQISHVIIGNATIMSAPAVIQSASNAGYTTATNVTQAFVSNNTAGNGLYACGFINDSNGTAGAFSDSAGNSWTTVRLFEGTNTTSLYVGYAFNAKAGANTVKLTSGIGSAALSIISIAEISNVNAVDQSNTKTTASTSSPYTGATLNPTQANSIVCSAFHYNGGGSMAINTPFTILGTENNNNFGISGYDVISTAASLGSTMTGNVGSNSASNIILNFYQASTIGTGSFIARPVPVTVSNSSGHSLAMTSPTLGNNNPQPLAICFTDINGNEYSVSGATVGNELGAPTPVVYCNAQGQPVAAPFTLSSGSGSLTFGSSTTGTKLGQPTPVVICNDNGNVLTATQTVGTALSNPIPIALCDTNGNALTLSGI